MTKREQAKKARLETEEAVRMYLRGAKKATITRKTGVPGWMINGLVLAQTLSKLGGKR